LKMIGRQIVSEFLDWLENTRNASVSTRNQRLAALKAFSKYAQGMRPFSA
jgi:integrase/recombinase XerD